MDRMEKSMKTSERLARCPTAGSVVQAVGKVTFLEIVRDRALYNVLVCAFLLLALALLGSRLSFLRPDRILLDIGLSAVSLSCCMLGILAGAGMLSKEFDRRTIYVALCHPISKAQFLLGKFAGLIAIVVMNWVLLSTAYLTILILFAGGWAIVSGTLIWGLVFSLFQGVLMSSVTVFFSTFSTTSMAVMFSFGIYLIGNSISQLRMVAAHLKSPAGSFLLNALSFILPDLEYFNLGTKMTYALPVSWKFICTSVFYGSFVVGFLLLLAGFLIQRREV